MATTINDLLSAIAEPESTDEATDTDVRTDTEYVEKLAHAVSFIAANVEKVAEDENAQPEKTPAEHMKDELKKKLKKKKEQEKKIKEEALDKAEEAVPSSAADAESVDQIHEVKMASVDTSRILKLLMDKTAAKKDEVDEEESVITSLLERIGLKNEEADSKEEASTETEVGDEVTEEVTEEVSKAASDSSLAELLGEESGDTDDSVLGAQEGVKIAERQGSSTKEILTRKLRARIGRVEG